MRTKWLWMILVTGTLLSCGGDDFISEEEQLEKDVAIIDQFLADNGIDAIKDPSGLRYLILQEGTGKKPTLNNTIEATFQGRLLETGVIFDQATVPASFPMPAVIRGWQIGFQLFGEGTAAVLYIPSGLGFGKTGSGATIPPNANLIFEVELITVK